MAPDGRAGARGRVAHAPGARAGLACRLAAGGGGKRLDPRHAREIVARRLNPPRASRALALVSVAMERASGKGVLPIHGAAPAILGELFPDRAAVFDARGRGLARSESQFARGRELALPVIERARTDGSDRTGAPPPLRGPGFWEPTPPAFAPALEPFAGSWRPWNVASVAALRPPPPPEPGSRQFTDELLEVYDVSRNLTEEQRRIASFWADGAGTVTPPGHWNMIALALVEEERLPALQAARALATLNTAQADAFIAAWETKFAYSGVRPVTAIRATIDADWLPLIATPPFPGYVSGHATTSGAASTVLAALFEEHARALRANAAEAAMSRLYGGIHCRSDKTPASRWAGGWAWRRWRADPAERWGASGPALSSPSSR